MADGAFRAASISCDRFIAKGVQLLRPRSRPGRLAFHEADRANVDATPGLFDARRFAAHAQIVKPIVARKQELNGSRSVAKSVSRSRGELGSQRRSSGEHRVKLWARRAAVKRCQLLHRPAGQRATR